MRSLAEFSTYQEVFKNCTALPAFFDSNLVDPGRVVKALINDPQAHIRIFYYQYLRLCFELENPKSQTYVQKFQELINNSTFQFIFYQDDDPSIYNDVNAKGLISQFFQLLGSGDYTVLQAINNNPIMDVILVHFFRTLLILTNQTENLDNYIPKEQLIDYLCNFFGVEVEFHGECCHYIESDIFVYEENESAVYMAYISAYDVESNYQSDQLQSKEEISPPSQPIHTEPKYQAPPPVQPKYQPPPAQPKYQPPVQAQPSRLAAKPPSQSYQTGKESYIASEFVDYTQTTEKLQNKVTTNLKGSDTNFNTYNPPKSNNNYNQFTSSNVESLTNNKPMAFIETASISSNSDNKNISQYIQQAGNMQPDYLTKSNPINRGQVTHLNFEQLPSSNSVTPVQPKPMTPPPAPVYQPPAQPIPTKDYAVSQSYASQSNQYNTQNQYISSSSKAENIIPPKPLSSNLSDSKKDFYYNPKVESSSYNQYAYSASASNTESLDYKSTVSYGVNSKAPAPVAASTATAGKKKPFGLNVSEEFTNSLTMKSMCQPFKSSVQGMKSRARNFRASLVNYIK